MGISHGSVLNLNLGRLLYLPVMALSAFVDNVRIRPDKAERLIQFSREINFDSTFKFYF